MKRVLFVLALLFAIVSCESEEQRIAKLIEQEMNLTLDDFDSYSTVSLDIKRSTLSAVQDYDIMKMGRAYVKAVADTTTLKEKEEEARWSYIRARQRNTRQKYSKARDKYHKGYIEAKNTVEAMPDSIRARARRITPQPIFEVRHVYRCKNEKGNMLRHDETFIIDESITNIIYREDNKDESIPSIKDAITALLDPGANK